MHKCSKDVRIADVGCALLTEDDKLYLGVSINACCGAGFCAEHSAIAAMVLEQRYKMAYSHNLCLKIENFWHLKDSLNLKEVGVSSPEFSYQEKPASTS